MHQTPDVAGPTVIVKLYLSRIKQLVSKIAFVENTSQQSGLG